MTLDEISPFILKALRSLTVKEALSRFDDPNGLLVWPTEIQDLGGSYTIGSAGYFDKECHRMSRIEFIVFVTSLT